MRTPVSTSSANAALLENKSLFTLSAAPHHSARLAAAAEAYDYIGASDDRYGYRAEYFSLMPPRDRAAGEEGSAVVGSSSHSFLTSLFESSSPKTAPTGTVADTNSNKLSTAATTSGGPSDAYHSLLSLCPLLRHTEALEDVFEAETAAVAGFYGLFGPSAAAGAARKRARVVSDADRMNAASASTNPFAVSRRSLITEFTIVGGPSAAPPAASAVGGGTTPQPEASSGVHVVGASNSSGGKSVANSLTSPTSPFPANGCAAAAAALLSLPPIKPSAAFAAPPATPAAATAAAAAASSAAASTPNAQLACEVARTIPIVCPSAATATAVHKMAIDLSLYGALCAVGRRQPFAGRSYVVGAEEGLEALVPPTAGGVSGGALAEGALGTTGGAVATAASGRQRRRGGAASGLTL